MPYDQFNNPIQISNQEARQSIIDDVRLLLGEGMIDIELDPEHYDLAVTKALERYRQRSENAVEESFAFLEIQPEQNDYVLPDEIIELRQIYRRGVGGTTTGGGSYLDPFSLAFNNLYLLRTGGQGGLATYDSFAQYQETIGRMFGQHIIFTFDTATKRLKLHRRFTTAETVLLWTYNFRPESILLTETYAKVWLRDYTVATCKMMLGEARSLYSSLPGPGGGITLNGDALKTEAQAEFERLEKEVDTQMEGGSMGYGLVIG